MTYNDIQVYNAVLRHDFRAFLHRAVLTLNPGGRFLPNWHIDAIAHALEEVRNGRIKRLIINLPPRHLKSIISSVAFPAFLLGHDAGSSKSAMARISLPSTRTIFVR
jgi:hypothetical protein